MYNKINSDSDILLEITSERSNDLSSVHTSNTTERSKTSSTKVFGNLHDHSSILADILEKHCLNKLSIGYYLLDDKMIGLGLLDETHKFYTDLILGNIPLNSSNIKLPYKLEIIKPTSYVSLV